MRKIEHFPMAQKVRISQESEQQPDLTIPEGYYQLPHHIIKGYYMFTLVSIEKDFEHVSCSLHKVLNKIGKTKMVERSLTYEEKTVLKHTFFHTSEVVVEFYPPNQDYIDNQMYVCHLYRHTGTLPIPDAIVRALTMKGEFKEAPPKPETNEV